MQIGFVIYGSLDTISGGYLYDRKLVEFLRAQGDTVEIISLPWRNYGAHLTDNLFIGQQAIQRQKFDIVIQDELNHPSLIRANMGRHACPIVSLVHHLRCSELRPAWQNAFYRIVEKKYLHSVDGLIFNSKTTEGVVTKLMKQNKPSVIGFPPTDRFRDKVMTEVEIKERATSDQLQVLFLGNVMHRKGLHTLLQAVASQPAAIRVDVVGGLGAEPQYAEEMKKFVTLQGLTSVVTFHGALDNNQLVEKYRQAHVLIVPSSYEGFGIVYLEGMGFGLPAIGTTAGAAGEIITHGTDGYLIQPGDSATLAGHIRDLATDRDLLLKLSSNALRRYTQQPSWNETANSIRAFLLQMVSS